MKIVSTLPYDVQLEEEMARRFTSRLHWELSTALTTNHLLSLISMANTMMTMGNGATFSASGFASESNRRKLIRKLSRQGSGTGSPGGAHHPTPPTSISYEEADLKRADQAKESWNVFASLHSKILPELLLKSSSDFKRPLVEIFARRWQDRCIEIREAAQTLLLAELKLIGSKGRRQIVEEWSPYLPDYQTIDQGTGHGGHQVRDFDRVKVDFWLLTVFLFVCRIRTIPSSEVLQQQFPIRKPTQWPTHLFLVQCLMQVTRCLAVVEIITIKMVPVDQMERVMMMTMTIWDSHT